VAFGAVLLGERLTVHHLLGLVLVLAGTFLGQRRRQA